MQHGFAEFTFQTYEEFLQRRGDLHQRLKEVLPEHKMQFEYAILEAMNNAFQHGHPQDGNQTCVKIKAVLMKRKLIIRIQDQGPGFPVVKTLGNISDQCDKYFKENLLRENGRGIPIMVKTSDYMQYNKRGNEILLLCRW